MLEPLRMVEVAWVDSFGTDGRWEYLDGLEPLEPVACVSVGFLLESENDYMNLGMSISHDQVLGRLAIPRSSITSVRYLKQEP